jgi:hypothetical protein
MHAPELCSVRAGTRCAVACIHCMHLVSASMCRAPLQVVDIVDNADGRILDQWGHHLPPCIVMDRGESLDIWSNRAKPDRTQAFSVRLHQQPATPASSPLHCGTLSYGMKRLRPEDHTQLLPCCLALVHSPGPSGGWRLCMLNLFHAPVATVQYPANRLVRAGPLQGFGIADAPVL